MLSFKPVFSLSSFTLIKRLFGSSSLSAIRVVSSAYLSLLIFFLEILIPACDSSSLAFRIMYSAYKLNKQGNNIQPCHTPFPILNQSVVPCLVLAAASQLAHRFLRRQICYFLLFKNSPQFIVTHTVKGFSIVSETELDVFLEFSYFPYDPMNVGNLISGSSAFSESSLYPWKFLVHLLLKPSLNDFEHNLASI